MKSDEVGAESWTTSPKNMKAWNKLIMDTFKSIDPDVVIIRGSHTHIDPNAEEDDV